MTETYAATIAAVAPVIWLVAAVEVHQYVKRYENMINIGDVVARAKQRAERIEGPMTRDQFNELSQLVAEGGTALRASFRVPRVKRYVSAAYLVIVALLLCAEALSLVWLAGPQSADFGVAVFCLIAVLVGFFAVSALPAITAFGVAAHVVGERGPDLDWLIQFLERQASMLPSEERSEGA
ncbi:hypothetical protein ACFZCT_29070 [Streptomyces qaidamensis]|jgi:hypothetical protein|uniref:hypothetical protein n=1 Tax=Streptomyces qaidamensis TaxID=1783515 RepID=UPI0036E29393